MKDIVKRLIPLVLLLPAFFSHAQVSNHKAYTLFIYSFTKYIQWPSDDPAAPFVIGVIGDSPIITELNQMAIDRKVGNRPIQVIALSNLNTVAQTDIIFLPASQSNQVSKLVPKIKNKPVLLITEQSGLTQHGASISFMILNESLKFEINKETISAQGLKVSKNLEVLAYKGS